MPRARHARLLRRHEERGRHRQACRVLRGRLGRGGLHPPRRGLRRRRGGRRRRRGETKRRARAARARRDLAGGKRRRGGPARRVVGARAVPYRHARGVRGVVRLGGPETGRRRRRGRARVAASRGRAPGEGASHDGGGGGRNRGRNRVGPEPPRVRPETQPLEDGAFPAASGAFDVRSKGVRVFLRPHTRADLSVRRRAARRESRRLAARRARVSKRVQARAAEERSGPVHRLALVRGDRGAAPEPGGGPWEAPGGRRAAVGVAPRRRAAAAPAARRTRRATWAAPTGRRARRRAEGTDEGTDEDVPSRLVGGVASGTPIVDGGRRTDASVEEEERMPRARRAARLRSLLARRRWAWSSWCAHLCNRF